MREQLQRHRSIDTGTGQDPRTSGIDSEDPWAAQQEDEDPFCLDLEGPDAFSTVGRNSAVTDSLAHNPTRPSAKRAHARGESDSTNSIVSAHNPTRPSAKRVHVRGESDSMNSTVSPPCKKPAPGVFHLPDRHDLKEALKSGGSVDAVRAPKGEFILCLEAGILMSIDFSL